MYATLCNCTMHFNKGDSLFFVMMVSSIDPDCMRYLYFVL